VRWVVLDGRLYDAMSLDELGNRPRQREPFFWELPAAGWVELSGRR
jgi:hypothetical protein